MLNNTPKRVFTVEETKTGEKLYEVSVLLKDVKGAVAEVAKHFADSNVNLKTGSLFYMPGKEGIGCWTTFIDVSKCTKTIAELERELQLLDVVLDVKFSEPKPAPYEVRHFPILHGDERAIIMPIELFGEMLDAVEKILSPSGFAAVFYDVGKKTGDFIIKKLEARYKLQGAELVEALGQAVKALGFGVPEIKFIDFQKLSGTIVIRDCMEALARKKKHYKVCHWSRGFMAGAFSHVFGKPVDVVENKCLAFEDEYCEFQIKPQTPLEDIKIPRTSTVSVRSRK
ncbi:MAG: V4R domain-containing protein [Candidatus Bathyarchaeia archaeon]